MKPEMLLIKTKNGSVLNYRAVVLAETAVERLTYSAFCRIPSDDAVYQFQRVAAANVVFVEWRDIDQRRRVPNRMILVVMHYIVGTRDEIAGPRAPVFAGTQRLGARMKWRPDGHRVVRILAQDGFGNPARLVDFANEITKYARLSKSPPCPTMTSSLSAPDTTA